MALLCSSVSATENQKSLETLRNRIKVLQSNIIAHEETKRNATDALRETERAISNINRKLVNLKKDKQRINKTLIRLQEKYRLVTKNLKAEQDQLNTLLYMQYLENQQNYLQALLNQQDPNQFARDFYYYRQLSQTRSESISSFQSKLDRLKEIAYTLRKKRKETSAIETEYATQNEKLIQEKLKHKTILAQISEEIVQQQKEISTLTQDEKRIAKLVNEINKLLKNKEGRDVAYNVQLPSFSNQNVAFPTLKGKLNLPVRGKLVGRFGGQRTGRHITWKGLFISSPSGSKVRAIANGHVVFSDWLRGFGNLMIIDHAHDYMSLYGNNEALFKQVGDIVQSGDTIATVGNSGGIANSGLYFELRHKGKALDPLTWIKLE